MRAGGVSATAGREATARNSLTVVGWTVISRVLGLARVLVIGATMGPTFLANIFQSGYLLPNTLNSTIAGPILTMVLIPTIVRALTGQGQQRATQLIGRVGGRILGVGLGGAALLILVSPALAWTLTVGVAAPLRHRAWLLAIVLLLSVAPQVVLYGLCALGVAAQQAQGRFALAAAAPTVENVGTIVTVLGTVWIYGPGLEVDRAPLAMMILLGTGTTVAAALHAALQQYGAYRCGMFTLPTRGWKTDPQARDAMRRVVRSVPVAACPAVLNYLFIVLAALVAGGVSVVQLAYQMYYALSFLGPRAVSMAALPRLAEAGGRGDSRRFAVAWRQGLFLAVLSGVPSLCLLACFASPTANLLANGRLRDPVLIGELAGCLAVAAFAQLAGGLHSFGRQALFSRLDDRGPRVASLLGLLVGASVCFSTLLLPVGQVRLAGLLVGVLASEGAAAVVVLVRLRASMRPEALITNRYLLVIALATASMFPVIGLGRYALYALAPGRGMEIIVLSACGMVSLGTFLLIARRMARRL